jgi:transposase
MTKRYVVNLTSEERSALEKLVNTGRASAKKQIHARILLKADISAEGSGWSDRQICEALEVSSSCVERVRKRLVEEGLEAALNRRPSSRPSSRRLDGEQEARLVALACSTPPQGHGAWTLRLLADQMVALQYVESISYETVRRTLKKRDQAAPETVLVHSSGQQCRVRLPHGRHSGGLHTPLRPPVGPWSAWTRAASNY